MRWCVILLALMLTGCVHNKPQPKVVTVNITPDYPFCLPEDHPKFEHGKVTCAPVWDNDPILHDPACLWVQGADEICTNNI